MIVSKSHQRMQASENRKVSVSVLRLRGIGAAIMPDFSFFYIVLFCTKNALSLS